MDIHQMSNSHIPSIEILCGTFKVMVQTFLSYRMYALPL